MKVGITGHQDLGTKETKAWLENEVMNKINLLDVSVGYSCLAAGADQLFAKIIIKKKIDLVAIIPSKNYDVTFHIGRELNEYRRFKSLANKLIQLNFEKPSELAFYESGKMIVEKADVLFAIWNEKPAKGLGGTADIVDYAKCINRKILHFNPITKKIKNY